MINKKPAEPYTFSYILQPDYINAWYFTNKTCVIANTSKNYDSIKEAPFNRNNKILPPIIPQLKIIHFREVIVDSMQS